MSNNKNNNKNKNLNIKKIEVKLLTDISKSILNKNNIDKTNININYNNLLYSKEKNLYMKDICNNLLFYKKNIENTSYDLHMTINKYSKYNKNINDIKKIKNNTQINENLDKSFFKITKSLDLSYKDTSNNKIIKYNNNNNEINRFTHFLKSIDDDIYKFPKHSSLFDFDNNNNNIFIKNNKYRTDNIYIKKSPENLNKTIPKSLDIKKTKININIEINNLDDLLKLIEDYPLKYDVEYNINMKSIHKIKQPLLELKNMIGMNRLKISIVDQILYFIQNFHKLTKTNNDFMHTVIYGPPGTGKTETAKIIGKIFSKLGILSKEYFKKVTRSDLIAGYLGQTAMKTNNVIKEAKGGVLFIDEAYSLGNNEKKDSFAKECIDTLCEGLSDNKNDLMVIIAGYKDELNKCFFAYNQGLDSRFTWRFNTDDYTFKELFLIFQKKVKDIGWKIKKNITNKWFEEKMDYFKFYGRDIETLLAKVKIAHGRRVFCLPIEKKTIITLSDLNKGYDSFLDNDEVKNRNNNVHKHILQHMYC